MSSIIYKDYGKFNFHRIQHVSGDRPIIPNAMFHCDHCDEDFEYDLAIFRKPDEIKPASDFCAGWLNICPRCLRELAPKLALQLKYRAIN